MEGCVLRGPAEESGSGGGGRVGCAGNLAPGGPSRAWGQVRSEAWVCPALMAQIAGPEVRTLDVLWMRLRRRPGSGCCPTWARAV